MLSKFSTTIEPFSMPVIAGPIPLTDREVAAVAGGSWGLVARAVAIGAAAFGAGAALAVVAGVIVADALLDAQKQGPQTPDAGDGPTGGAGGSGD